MKQWQILRGCPLGSKFFQFHAVFGKFWQNRMLAPPGVGTPPQGNPGSATVKDLCKVFLDICMVLYSIYSS